MPSSFPSSLPFSLRPLSFFPAFRSSWRLFLSSPSLCALGLLAFLLTGCSRTPGIEAGKYEIADQEWKKSRWRTERTLLPDGQFRESHYEDHCMLVQIDGRWSQDGDRLVLAHERIRLVPSCAESTGEWKKDSTEAKIPIRNVAGGSFETFLPEEGQNPSKWLRWEKREETAGANPS